MFSKEQSAQLKRDFWTAFGKSFPRKWILYDTKVKDLSFKFHADKKTAEVSINLEMKDDLFREAYFEKFESLENILRSEIPEIIFDKNFILENGKVISKIYIQKNEVSIFNKNTWREIYEFFVENMTALEMVFLEYEDYIKSV